LALGTSRCGGDLHRKDRIADGGRTGAKLRRRRASKPAPDQFDLEAISIVVWLDEIAPDK
jgi:hypothetical protein